MSHAAPCGRGRRGCDPRVPRKRVPVGVNPAEAGIQSWIPGSASPLGGTRGALSRVEGRGPGMTILARLTAEFPSRIVDAAGWRPGPAAQNATGGSPRPAGPPVARDDDERVPTAGRREPAARSRALEDGRQRGLVRPNDGQGEDDPCLCARRARRVPGGEEQDGDDQDPKGTAHGARPEVGGPRRKRQRGPGPDQNLSANSLT